MPVYDPMKGIAMGISGLYERTVANTGGRTAKLYASKDAYLGAYVVVLTTPEGQETATWLAESGWIERADEEKLVLYVLEPGASGEWGTPAEELPYVETAVYHFADARGNYYQPSESYYAVGYDAGGAALQQAVMKDPILFAAGAFVDASDISSEFLDTLDTDFYATPDWDGNQVPSSAVPMPVWLVNSEGSPNADGVVDHWKQANQTRNKATGGFKGSKFFEQKDGTLYGYVADTSRVTVGVLEKRNVRQDTGNQAEQARRQDLRLPVRLHPVRRQCRREHCWLATRLRQARRHLPDHGGEQPSARVPRVRAEGGQASLRRVAKTSRSSSPYMALA